MSSCAGPGIAAALTIAAEAGIWLGPILLRAAP
jgi:hypothetical protein